MHWQNLDRPAFLKKLWIILVKNSFSVKLLSEITEQGTQGALWYYAQFAFYWKE